MSENEENKVEFKGGIDKAYVPKNLLKAFIITSMMALVSCFLAIGIMNDIDEKDIIRQIFRPFDYLLASIVLILITLVFPMIVAFGYSKKYVNNFHYEINQKFVVTTSGVFTNDRTTIPFSRIQNISVKNGVFDRLFKLFTLKIETAVFSNPSEPKAEGFIPAIKNPSEIEEFINQYIHQYTQRPAKLEGYIFEDTNVAFDEFIAYILSKMLEGENLKTRIKELRAKYDLTQADLAEKVGVSRQTILYLEKGKYIPSLTLALKLAKILDVKVEELFELEEETESE